MTLRRILTGLANIVADEAAQNHTFRARIEDLLTNEAPKPKKAGERASDEKRRGGRRAPATVDPIDLARNGEGDLRSRLAGLDLNRLLDIVAQYGMDPGKLVMKWKDPQRIIDRIVEVSLSRSTKGDAFRTD